MILREILSGKCKHVGEQIENLLHLQPNDGKFSFSLKRISSEHQTNISGVESLNKYTFFGENILPLILNILLSFIRKMLNRARVLPLSRM